MRTGISTKGGLAMLVLPAALAALLVTGCKRDDATTDAPAADSADAATDATVQDAAPDADAPAEAPADPAATDAPAAAPATPFDVTTVPEVATPATPWPYFTAPDGYEFDGRTLDLSQVPFWTGQALQQVEGKVYEARVRAVGEKTYSRFEVLKRIDQALAAAGAVKVTTSQVPEEVLDEQLPDDFGVEFNAGAGGYYGDQEVSTYVLRHPTGVTWFKVYSDGNGGSLLVAEAEPGAAPESAAADAPAAPAAPATP